MGPKEITPFENEKLSSSETNSDDDVLKQENNNCFGRQKKSRQIFLLAVLFLVIVIPLLLYFVTNATEDEPENDENANGLPQRQIRCTGSGEKDILLLEKAKPEDFACMPQESKSLRILSLGVFPYDFELSIPANSYMRNLTINCPISEKWLKFLLNHYPNLETLRFDEDLLCENPRLGQDPLLFPKHVFPKLNTLIIDSINHNCPLTELVLDNWRTPVLKIITINNSNINYPFFEHLRSFLKNLVHSIEIVEIYSSYISKDFDLFDINYENIKRIAIMSRKTYITDWDEYNKK